MKVEIKNYRTFQAHDGYGYECSLYIDGERTAVITDDGYGEELNWFPIGDHKSEQFQITGRRMHAFIEKCKALPVYVTKEGWELDMSWELFLDDLVQLADIKAQAKGGKIIIKEKEDGEFYTVGKGYKAKNRDRVLDAVANNYPNAFLVNGCKVEATI
ncbi:hypothetical protein LCGC14_0917970 [marine sediment metagenome]|uniref:Uncharacterized protein n=1 Tax=marine sediment metagenome TaxID=412755 RepID=A0A0F9PCE2_9ZZZZ